MKLAEQLIGMPRHLSQHVGGFILTERPLTETVPIGNGAMDDRTFIEWDKDDIDELGILKIDVLALGMLTCIRKCFDLIEQHHGERWELATVPQEVPEVYDMLCRGRFARRVPGREPGADEHAAAAQAALLLRPRDRGRDRPPGADPGRHGPSVPEAPRRQGAGDLPLPGPRAWPARRARADPRADARRADLPGAGDEDRDRRGAVQPAEANQLRKAMATFRSKGKIEQLEEKMVGRMVERGYDPDFAQRCFDQIKGFGEYGFPESHAASFAHLVYVSSWLKWKYPAAFACALLNSQPMGFYAPAQIVRDAREHGVEVREVDVNQSEWDCTLESRGGAAGCADAAMRAGPFSTRSAGRGAALRLGLRQVDGLRASGGSAGARRPYGRRGAAQRGARAGARDPAARRGRRVPLDGARPARGAVGLARAQGGAGPAAVRLCRGLRRGHGSEPAQLPAMPLAEHVVNDYQTIRLSLKAHPMTFLREHYARAEIRHRRAARPSATAGGCRSPGWC